MMVEKQSAMLQKDDGTYWIWTAQIAKHRLIKSLGLSLLDITVKSGIKEFSPTWDMLMAYKGGQMSAEEYNKLYREKIRKSIAEKPELWKKLLERKNIVLACYCTPGIFCHRLIFKEFLIDYLRKQNLEAVDKGEFHSGSENLIKKELTIQEVDAITSIPY